MQATWINARHRIKGAMNAVRGLHGLKVHWITINARVLNESYNG